MRPYTTSMLLFAGKLGKFGVSDEDRLICVGTINARTFIPSEINLLGDLIDAGISSPIGSC